MSILNEIRFNNLKGDLFGGVTAAVIALPMALAFGVASGAGAIAGRYGAVLVGLFASLSGGTGPLIFEQVGTLTVVTTAGGTLRHHRQGRLRHWRENETAAKYCMYHQRGSVAAVDGNATINYHSAPLTAG